MTKHSKAHGLKVLRDTLFAEALAAEQARAPAGAQGKSEGVITLTARRVFVQHVQLFGCGVGAQGACLLRRPQARPHGGAHIRPGLCPSAGDADSLLHGEGAGRDHLRVAGRLQHLAPVRCPGGRGGGADEARPGVILPCGRQGRLPFIFAGLVSFCVKIRGYAWCGEGAAHKPRADSVSTRCPQVGQSGDRKTLLTTRARGENDILCKIGCLFFDSEAGVRGFLNTGGNAALLDGPLIQVRGLRRPGSDGLAPAPGDTMSVFCIMVGAARLVTDFRTAGRHHPNVRIRVQPGLGPNDGFLELIARTHNGQGIAAGREVLLDFGARYTPTIAPDGGPIKRFRGALDALLEKQAASFANVDNAPSGAPEEIPEQGGPAPQPEKQLGDRVAYAPGEAGYQVLVQDGGIVVKSAGNNKCVRIAPKTVLKVFDKGTMEAPDEAKAAKNALEAQSTLEAKGMMVFAFKRTSTQAPREMNTRPGQVRPREALPRGPPQSVTSPRGWVPPRPLPVPAPPLLPQGPRPRDPPLSPPLPPPGSGSLPFPDRCWWRLGRRTGSRRCRSSSPTTRWFRKCGRTCSSRQGALRPRWS